MGHIFQLGRWFAEALDLKVLDENGKLVTVTMGSYGIGVTRAVAAIAEGNNDELGLIWPREISPADVHLVAAGKDGEIFETAARIAEELAARGVDVLYDDRTGKVSPGVKFKDAELIGVPTIVTVGRGLADGVVEVRDRAHRRARGRRGRRGRRPPRRGRPGWLRRTAPGSTPSSSTGAARSPAGTTSTSTPSRWRWPTPWSAPRARRRPPRLGGAAARRR